MEQARPSTIHRAILQRQKSLSILCCSRPLHPKVSHRTATAFIPALLLLSFLLSIELKDFLDKIRDDKQGKEWIIAYKLLRAEMKQRCTNG
jgi:hypothetical protein